MREHQEFMSAQIAKTNNHPAIEVFPEDIFLVSYPKSGNTWLRFMIGNYLSDDPCDFTKLSLLIPDVYVNPEHISQLSKPRIIKSHEPFVTEYSRVVYVVRDGRDVAVSYYFFALKQRYQNTRFNLNTTFEEFVNVFNAGQVDGFTLWSEHVNSWLNQATDNFLLIKYEDMKADPGAELIRFLTFAGITVEDDRVAQAVKASSFKNMRRIEKESYQPFEWFNPSDPSIIYFVRKGEIGDWQEFFTDQTLAEFIEIHGSALEQLGYLPPRIAAGFQFRKDECLELQVKQQQAQDDYAQLQAKFEQLNSQYTDLNTELEQAKHQQQAESLYRQDLQHQIAQYQTLQQQLQTQLEQQQAKSQQLQGKLNQVRERSQKRQQNLQVKLEQTQAVIQAMESSKFWQLRTYWLKLKNLLN